ncbi:MAG TPA: ATP-binding protein [Candidatus Methylacidiphilales bacterium]|nr:ATP-binding protein [Candidatus Methylacidiphilales bacterium]
MNWLRDMPIRQKMTVVILLTTVVALLLLYGGLGIFQILDFRKALARDAGVLADVLAKNTQAALAFQDENAAQQTLLALQAEPNVVAAALYDATGNRFAGYVRDNTNVTLPSRPSADGSRFDQNNLTIFHPVMLNGKLIGTIYLQISLQEMYNRLGFSAGLAATVLAGSVLIAFALASRLQRPISQPILTLADTARRIAENKDYTVRVAAKDRDEIGSLTDAFNQLLASIEERDKALRTVNESLRGEIAERKGAEDRVQAQVARLELLHRITRAIGERQDLQSIFQVVIRTVEEHLPVDFCCICVHEPAANVVTINRVGVRGGELALELGQPEHARLEIGRNGLAKCISGELIFEPDMTKFDFPFFQRLARDGLRALVMSPLLVESSVFGILIAARRPPESFSSAECEFLRQLSGHVGLAAHQAQLYEALHQAYDDLRQTQQAVMQQERLRALGQMASGIAHDINNAISPVSLYTESLLENEPHLSERARDYLGTIQRAIEDVAQTVSRMKEFYRQREPQLTLAPVNLNQLTQQVIDLSRARWNDIPQQRGIVIRMETDLEQDLPAISGVESEIREAMVNLVFNAVDAMPEGGTLTLRTKFSAVPAQVRAEVADTGIGMDEETRRRCFEPFFTTKGERGTGLGLAMVHGIARRNNAEIEINSTVGQGTTIRLIFPVVASSPDAKAPAAAPSAAPSVAPPRLRLLVVDDDPLLIKSLRDTLEGDGHVVVAASGGREGIEVFRQAFERREPFATVITDLGMPYVNGRQVAAEIKALSPGTPIILLTGWGQRLVAEGDVPLHIDRVLNKPPKLRELREALAHCLR